MFMVTSIVHYLVLYSTVLYCLINMMLYNSINIFSDIFFENICLFHTVWIALSTIKLLVLSPFQSIVLLAFKEVCCV